MRLQLFVTRCFHPLERSKELGHKQFFTASEADEFERVAADREFKKLPLQEHSVNAGISRRGRAG